MNPAIDSVKKIESEYLMNPDHLIVNDPAVTEMYKQYPSVIHRSAIVHPGVLIGWDVYIGPNCVIGYNAEIRSDSSYCGKVVIRNHVRIEGMVTIDSGSKTYTTVHSFVMIMKQCHVGHDAQIGEYSTLSPGCRIGGYAFIHKYCNIGMNAVIHQRTHVPDGCMIGMGAIIPKNKELLPYRKYVNVAQDIGENTKAKEKYAS